MNQWFSPRPNDLNEQGVRMILMIVLLTVITVFGVFSFTSSAPTAHAAGGFNLIYSNGSIVSKACTFQNQGVIIAPEEVSNSCSVRVWLYSEDQRAGSTLCITPHTTTGILHTAWHYFWVSQNSSHC